MPQTEKREVIKELMGRLVNNWESQNLPFMDEKPLLNEITKLVTECDKLASFRSSMTNNLVWIGKKVALYDVEFDISGGRSPNKGSKKTRVDEAIEDQMVRISLLTDSVKLLIIIKYKK